MITSKNILHLREKILLDPLFFCSYENAMHWGRQYQQIKNERFSVSDHFRMLMIKNKWGRRSGYAFLQIIAEDYENSVLQNNELKAELMDLENRILGHCASTDIIRFYHDPTDIDELVSYVRSGRWLNEDFYKKEC